MMNKHQGQIVEYIVRKNGYNLSELAKELNVNRRSLYNWFSQERLKAEIIYRIGCVIRYDFSKEFPEYFSCNEFEPIYAPKHVPITAVNNEAAEDEAYKDKYMELLERFNNDLAKLAGKELVAD